MINIWIIHLLYDSIPAIWLIIVYIIVFVSINTLWFVLSKIMDTMFLWYCQRPTDLILNRLRTIVLLLGCKAFIQIHQSKSPECCMPRTPTLRVVLLEAFETPLLLRELNFPVSHRSMSHELECVNSDTSDPSGAHKSRPLLHTILLWTQC